MYTITRKVVNFSSLYYEYHAVVNARSYGGVHNYASVNFERDTTYIYTNSVTFDEESFDNVLPGEYKNERYFYMSLTTNDRILIFYRWFFYGDYIFSYVTGILGGGPWDPDHFIQK